MRWIFAAILLSFLIGCRSETDAVVRRKLDVIVKDDLLTVLNEIKADTRAGNPTFSIVEYTTFKKSVYSTKAVVDFYLFKNVKVKMVRKYRYHSQAKQWERYLNEYRFVHDTLSP